jgi:hypothetical protein
MNQPLAQSILIVCLAAGLIQPLLLAQTPVSSQAAQQSGKSPVKVFILAGQSNMEGQAVADLVGEALGEAMAELLAAPQRKDGPDPSKPASHAIRNIEGWTVRVDG